MNNLFTVIYAKFIKNLENPWCHFNIKNLHEWPRNFMNFHEKFTKISPTFMEIHEHFRLGICLSVRPSTFPGMLSRWSNMIQQQRYTVLYASLVYEPTGLLQTKYDCETKNPTWFATGLLGAMDSEMLWDILKFPNWESGKAFESGKAILIRSCFSYLTNMALPDSHWLYLTPLALPDSKALPDSQFGNFRMSQSISESINYYYCCAHEYNARYPLIIPYT